MDFIIRKDIYGSWWHDYNNDATKVNISDFEAVIDDVANTFIIQNKNGSNVPSKAVSIADVKVINQIVSNTPISFSGAVGLKNLLTSLNYTPYVVSGGGGGGAVDSVNGQTGVVVIPLDYLPLAGGTMDAGADIFFDNGSALREGTYDFGGDGGISRICSVDYEDMWQAGIRHVFDNNGLIRHSTNCFDVVPDSSFDNTLRFKIDSLWTLDNGTTYKCTDASTGAAVWELYTFGTIPTLDQVLNEGYTGIDKSILLDSSGNIGYASLNYNQLVVADADYASQLYKQTLTFNSSLTNNSASYGVGLIGFSTSGSTVTSISFENPTGINSIVVPDGSGTLAFTSDIPAAGVTSVGLTMPSAFTVTNSPITSSGDIAVTGAGAVSQYVRGDGTLANFPTSSGGGSSLSFYLNGSVSQGTIGGVAFREMDRTPILGVGTDFTINANGYIQSFITDAGVPNLLEIPAGNWNFETYFSASSGGGSPSFYVELYKWDGTTLSLIASNSANPEFITGGTNTDLYVSALAVPQTTLLATDRLAIRIYVTHSGRTIKLHTEDNHLCQVITTFSTGLTALNGLTAQVQNLAVGTTGTDFGIVSSGSTHTFNLPNASAANRGLLTSADWTAFNNKQNTATLIFDSLQKAIMRDNYFWFVPNTISTGIAANYGYSERLVGSNFTLSNSGTLLRGLIPFSSTATAGTIAFLRKNDAMILTGLEVVFTRKIQFNSNVSGQRFYCGISKGNQFSAPTNVEPSTLTDIVGVCQLSSSTNMHVVHNDASGTATTIDLGSSYPCTDSQYNYFITIEQTTTTYIVTVERVTVSTGASITTTNILSTNIPNYATGTIQLLTWISNNATAAIASYLDGGAIGNVKNQ